MTTQHYLDSIKGIFPNVPDTQILKDIDKSQKLFATETGMTTYLGALSSISTAGWLDTVRKGVWAYYFVRPELLGGVRLRLQGIVDWLA